MAKKQIKNGLTVRELTINDAYAYYQIANDASLKKYTNFFMASSITDARAKIEKFTSHYERIYGVFNKANRLMAVIDVDSDPTFSESDKKTATVSYFVGKEFRGRRLASIGIKILAKSLKSQFDYFIFEIQRTNEASISVQKKLNSSMSVNEGNYMYFSYAL